MALSKPEVMKGRDELDILVKADKDANTITIEWVLTQPLQHGLVLCGHCWHAVVHHLQLLLFPGDITQLLLLQQFHCTPAC
jgi:hypothetical protein